MVIRAHNTRVVVKPTHRCNRRPLKRVHTSNPKKGTSMHSKNIMARTIGVMRLGLTGIAVTQLALGVTLANAAQSSQGSTKSPIKHVIVLIGENRTFDHLFATFVPKSRDSVKNLLSEGIINADGSPGRHFAQAAQFQAVAPFQTQYFISLTN